MTSTVLVIVEIESLLSLANGHVLCGAKVILYHSCNGEIDGKELRVERIIFGTLVT